MEQEVGLVFDIKRFSIHDGPGIRTTVFLKGCPLNCQWCHNPEGQAPVPELILRPDHCFGCAACVGMCTREAITLEKDVAVTERERCLGCGICVEVCFAGARELVGRWVTVDDVLDEIERDVVFYDQSHGGVTFSGGEPLAQPRFLEALLRTCQTRSLHTTLDTCGFAPWETLDNLRDDVDLFLYDLKLMDRTRHRELTGVSNEPILKNLQDLSRRGHRIVLRIPIIPGINDDENNLTRMGAFAARLPALERVDLLPYHRIGRDKYRRLGKSCPMPETDSPLDDRMATVADLLRGFDLRVNLNH